MEIRTKPEHSIPNTMCRKKADKSENGKIYLRLHFYPRRPATDSRKDSLNLLRTRTMNWKRSCLHKSTIHWDKVAPWNDWSSPMT
jgi:hypothetical protein